MAQMSVTLELGSFQGVLRLLEYEYFRVGGICKRCLKDKAVFII